MALSWMGLAPIPLRVTIKPRNLPELTPNAHFKELVSCRVFTTAQRFLVNALCGWAFFGFYEHIIDINLHGFTYQGSEYPGHHHLKVTPAFFKPNSITL